MMFESFSGNRRSRRHNLPIPASAMVESLETRSLLSAAPTVSVPSAVSPGPNQTPVIQDSTPKIVWTAVDGATSYDVWINDVESRQRIDLASALPSQILEYTPTKELNLGVNRIWVRANFGNNPAGPWSTAVDVMLQTKPVVTGPVAMLPVSPPKINGNTFPVTWQCAPGARYFDVFLSNQTTLTSTTYRVANQVPLLDARGNAIPDGTGSIVRQEVRELYLNGPVALAPQVPKTIVAATNDTSIVLTVPSHGLKTGEQVRISGAEGNTAANGTWLVTVTGSDTIRLTGVAGNGVYTGGGTLVQLTQLRSVLPIGQYRVFVRSTDDANPGRLSAWSDAYDFEVAPAVNILRPTGPTFDTPITLEWEPVPDATHYELLVKPKGTDDSKAIVNIKYLRDTSYQLPTSQISTLAFSGSPTQGTFRLSFRIPGETVRTLTTSSLPWNATAEQIRGAVAALGFQNTTIRTTTAGANPVYELRLSNVAAPIQVIPTTDLSPGTISVSSRQVPPDFSDLEFRVRARRLTQVTEVSSSGKPVSGTFALTLVTPGTKGTTQTTGNLSYSSSDSEVQAAIRKLAGFETAEVRSRTTDGNTTWSLILPQFLGPVTVTASSQVSPGSVGVTKSRTSPEVIGLWSHTSEFTTNVTPTVTPVPGSQVYTSVRPTLTWTKIDRSARYEIWVDRNAQSSVFLKTSSASNSYTFESDVPAGNYWVWVRAVSVSGNVGPWSAPYQFAATGGAPVITSPLNNSSSSNALPTILWTGVAEAATYEIQIAWLNNQFDFIRATGITGTAYSVESPLNAGSYRVWLRGVKADGTALAWSAPTTFTVT